jgi:hypothetical protein
MRLVPLALSATLIRVISGLAFVAVTALLPVSASAISATCLPGGFPSTPTSPVVGKDVSYFDDRYHIDVWRVPCQDGSGQVALLLRATAITPGPFVCSGTLTLIQGGVQLDPKLAQTSGNSASSFCGDLLVATTFSLERWHSSDPPFDNKAAFTLDVEDPRTGHTTLEVPAADTAPPVPHIDFNAAMVSAASPGITIQGTGDFNGDGKVDTLWRDATGLVSVWLMSGAGVASVAAVTVASLNWTIHGIGDFDGDGKADILWREATGLVGIWFMDGATLLHPALVGNAPLDWTIAGVGDADGDSRADILWRHSPSGAVGVWIMDVVL